MSTTSKNGSIVSALAHRSGAPVLLLAGVTAFAGLGCNTQGQARNPTFTAAAAPDPTVVVAPVACRSEFANKSGDAMQSQFNLLLKAQLNVKPVVLDAEQQTAVCGAMSGMSNGVSDWKARATLMAVVQSVTKGEHAQSVLVPVAKYSTQCLRDQSVVKDADGHTIASVDRGTETCKESGVALHALLFGSDGSLLWKSWAGVRGGGAGMPGIGGMIASSGQMPDMEKSVTALLVGIPAKFVDAGGAGAPAVAANAAPSAPPASAAAAPAAPASDDADAIVSAKLGDGPIECKQLARAMCDRVASTPMHAQLCATYASSYKAMAGTPNGAKLCRTQLAAVKPHG